jgi:aminoglycoside phosphotransferase (APT) family kinase protein
MPRILFADFTHALIDRDYMFQTRIEGERWEDIADQLARTEADALWQQFGAVVRRIHDTPGETFGSPFPEASFATWSTAFIHRLDRISNELRTRHGDADLLAPIHDLVIAHRHILDEVQQPHLLHGDLWLFNILINRSGGSSAINGVLDADRAWCGDPMADWTMFVLRKSESEETRQAHRMFWEGYGPRALSANAEIRGLFYDAMNASSGFVWAIKEHDAHTQALATAELRALAQRLAASLS